MHCQFVAIFANIIQIAAQKDDVAPWRWCEMDWTLPPLFPMLKVKTKVNEKGIKV